MEGGSKSSQVETKSAPNEDDGSLSEIMKMIIDLCQESEKGITDRMLQISISGLNSSPLVRADAINKLLASGSIEICKTKDQLLYRTKKQLKSRGADEEEKIVYSIIEKAGNKGIWSRDIRQQSNISLTQLSKVLKSMESNNLIKSVKSVAASKKKVYMLYELEPDRSLTGGAWYHQQDHETEFIEVLRQQCLRFLVDKNKCSHTDREAPSKAPFVSSNEVCHYIKELGISNVELNCDEIENILDTLVYDGKVEKYVAANQLNKLYRALPSLGTSTGIMRMPCGLCPVIKDCYEGGPICPSNCLYLKEWLDL